MAANRKLLANVDFKLGDFLNPPDGTCPLGVVGLATLGEFRAYCDKCGTLAMPPRMKKCVTKRSIARKMTLGNETPSVAHQLKQGLEIT